MALAIIEIGRHGNHRLGDRFAQIGFGISLELLEHHRRDFGGRVIFAAHRHAHIAIGRAGQLIRHQTHVTLDNLLTKFTPNETLSREDRILGVSHGLTAGHLADHALAGLIHCHHRRGEASTFGVGNNDGLAALNHGDDRVGSSQIDSNNFWHTPTTPTLTDAV